MLLSGKLAAVLSVVWGTRCQFCSATDTPIVPKVSCPFVTRLGDRLFWFGAPLERYVTVVVTETESALSVVLWRWPVTVFYTSSGAQITPPTHAVFFPGALTSTSTPLSLFVLVETR